MFKDRHLLNRCVFKVKYWWIVIHVTIELSRCRPDAAHLINLAAVSAEEGVKGWAVSLARSQRSPAGSGLGPRSRRGPPPRAPPGGCRPCQPHSRRGTDTGLGARRPWAALSSAPSAESLSLAEFASFCVHGQAELDDLEISRAQGVRRGGWARDASSLGLGLWMEGTARRGPFGHFSLPTHTESVEAGTYLAGSFGEDEWANLTPSFLPGRGAGGQRPPPPRSSSLLPRLCFSPALPETGWALLPPQGLWATLGTAHPSPCLSGLLLTVWVLGWPQARTEGVPPFSWFFC